MKWRKPLKKHTQRNTNYRHNIETNKNGGNNMYTKTKQIRHTKCLTQHNKKKRNKEHNNIYETTEPTHKHKGKQEQ